MLDVSRLEVFPGFFSQPVIAAFAATLCNVYTAQVSTGGFMILHFHHTKELGNKQTRQQMGCAAESRAFLMIKTWRIHELIASKLERL